MIALTEQRLQMFGNGWDVRPAVGKKVLLNGWSTLQVTPDVIKSWEEYPGWTDTGGGTAYTPCWDSDITAPEPAAAIEQLLRDRLDGRGELLVRTGQAPKRGVMLRTNAPFYKKRYDWTAPNGDPHHIEVLCNGQQVILYGTHEKTGQPYTWHGGRGPLQVHRDELVDITEAEIAALLDEADDLLISQFGFEPSGGPGSSHYLGNGVPVVLDRELTDMRPGNIHLTQLRCADSMMRHGFSADAVVARLLPETRRAADADGAAWDWSAMRSGGKVGEEWRIREMCYSFVNKNPELAASALPDDLYRERRQRRAANVEKLLIRWDHRNRKWHIPGPPIVVTGPEPLLPQRSIRTVLGRGNQIIRVKPFVSFDVRLLERRAHLYGEHYLRKHVSLSVGADGGGKSTTSIAEGVSLATRRPLLGEMPAERCRVWLHNADDDGREMQRRIAACCQLHNVPMAELEGWLFVTTAEDFSIRIAYGGSNQILLDMDTIEAITEEITANRFDVTIFDPLVATHEVPENTNGCMDTVIRTLDRIANFCNCAIDLPHHPRKGVNGAEADRTISADDSRGAGSIRAAARGQRLFNRMTRAEAAKANVPEDEREFYIRIHRGKASYVPPATQAKWLKLTNVVLSNGDNVGGIVSWAYPTQGGPEQAVTRDKADHVFLAVLARYNESGRRVSDKKQGVYAPREFADAPEVLLAKLCEADMAAAMRRLLNEDRIHIAKTTENYRKVHWLQVGAKPSEVSPQCSPLV